MTHENENKLMENFSELIKIVSGQAEAIIELRLAVAKLEQQIKIDKLLKGES